MYTIRISDDPNLDVAVLNAKEIKEEDFYRNLQAAERTLPDDAKEAFVFVHGYNVTFEDAVRRTAQLAYDLKFAGPAICYSWPSQGAIPTYFVDESNAEWTTPHLKDLGVTDRPRSRN